jgi:DNA-binding NarL/FixJ family response regulator
LTVLVADDHPAVLAAVTALLRDAGLNIVGTARDGEEALAKILTRRPDVALVDVRMPRLEGIELTRRAAKEAPETSILLYSGYGDRALVTEALDAGARGFVLKEAPLDDLVRALETVAAGDQYIDPLLAGLLISAKQKEQAAALSPRERDVLRLLTEGLSNEEAGKRLFISAETVRTHIAHAMRKLGADTRTQAVAIALRENLIT